MRETGAQRQTNAAKGDARKSDARKSDVRKTDARKYGRRRALLEAECSAERFDAATKRLLSDVERAGASRATITRLRASVAAATDVTRRRASVWAILAELEALETA